MAVSQSGSAVRFAPDQRPGFWSGDDFGLDCGRAAFGLAPSHPVPFLCF